MTASLASLTPTPTTTFTSRNCNGHYTTPPILQNRCQNRRQPGKGRRKKKETNQRHQGHGTAHVASAGVTPVRLGVCCTASAIGANPHQSSSPRTLPPVCAYVRPQSDGKHFPSQKHVAHHPTRHLPAEEPSPLAREGRAIGQQEKQRRREFVPATRFRRLVPLRVDNSLASAGHRRGAFKFGLKSCPRPSSPPDEAWVPRALTVDALEH